jgi:hypothetical protein
MFTPTSWYWNCVCVSAVAVSVELEVPTAIGTLSPIFSVAFCPSTERNCGRCRTFVSLSVIKNATLDDGIETAKSVAFRCPRLFSVKPEVLVAVVVLLVLVEVAELVIVGLWNEMLGLLYPP